MQTEICYILGALRDGTIDVREGKNYELRFYQDDETWLRRLGETVLHSFNVKIRLSKNLLRINGKKFISQLIQISGYKKPQTNWGTPEIIKHASRQEKWVYVSAFFDTEGGLPSNPLSAIQKYVSFDQKNKEALDFIRSFLVEEGLRPTNLTYTGGVWQFRITRKKHIDIFSRKISSLHAEKFFRLQQLVPSIT